MEEKVLSNGAKVCHEFAWSTHYRGAKVNVFAPRLYYARKHDAYSQKVYDSKSNDLSNYFFDDIKKIFDSYLIGFTPQLIIALPSSNGSPSPTIYAIARKLSVASKVDNENIIKLNENYKKQTSCNDVYERYLATKDLTVSKSLGDHKKIILLDDIKTTGLLILACNEKLKELGATSVSAICLGINYYGG